MPQSKATIEIPLNKSKLRLMFGGSVLFVLIGLWFMIAPPAGPNSIVNDPTTLGLIGLVTLLFFGLMGFLLIRKLSDNTPGLIIDEQGIIDNSSAVALGRIAWSDMTGLSVMEIQRQKFILIGVKNPDQFLQSQTSALKRKVIQSSIANYGTPVSISTNGLSIAFDELLQLLQQHLSAK